MKRLILTSILIIVLLTYCKVDDYEVDYDDEKIKFGYDNNKIAFENNLEYPVVLDHITVNDKEIKNFFKYEVCDFIRNKDEVFVDYNGELNQIIYLTSIVLPGKKKEIEYTLKKGDEVELEFYPLNYNFLSDNVYFIDKNISEKEKKYKLYPGNDIKKLNISDLENKEEINIIDGIMIFVKEYNAMDDFLEKVEFEMK